jgi:hypothetical protein
MERGFGRRLFKKTIFKPVNPLSTLSRAESLTTIISMLNII